MILIITVIVKYKLIYLLHNHYIFKLKTMSITFKDFKFNDISTLSLKRIYLEVLNSDQEKSLNEFVKDYSNKDFTTPQTLFEYKEQGNWNFSISKGELILIKKIGLI